MNATDEQLDAMALLTGLDRDLIGRSTFVEVASPLTK